MTLGITQPDMDDAYAKYEYHLIHEVSHLIMNLQKL